MGKLVGSIALVAAAVAVNFVPGIGQAISGAVVSGLGGTFGSIAVGAAVAGAITTGVTIAGLSSLASIAGLGPKIPKTPTTESSIKNPIPPRVRGYGVRRLFGASIFFDSSVDVVDGDSGSTGDVYAVFDGKANALLQWYLNDDKVTVSGTYVQALADKRYQNDSIYLDYRLGLETETAYAPIVAAFPSTWTNNHRGDGVVTFGMLKKQVKDKIFLETYPQGDSVNPSAVLELAPVFDPRDDAQIWNDPTTWVFSENACLHHLHFEMVEAGRDYPTEIEPRIDYWMRAADVCDEPVPLKAGGTEPRYRGCVVYNASDDPKGVRAELLSCYDGWMAKDSDGCLIVYAGEYYTPTVTLGADEIINAQCQSFIEDEQSVNELVISFISAENDYNQIEAEAWRNDDDIAKRGLVRSQTFAPQSPSPAQNRRLAKASMIRTQAVDRGTVTTNLAGRAAQGQRFVNLDINDSGVILYSGPVEIVGLTRDFTAGGVTIEWIAADPNAYDWDADTEEGSTPPEAVRTPGAALVDPTITLVTPSVDEGVAPSMASLLITATGPNRDDLTWYVRLNIDGIWSDSKEYADTSPGATVSLKTDAAPVNKEILVQVAYKTGDGRVSDWSTEYSVEAESELPLPVAISDSDFFIMDQGDGTTKVYAEDVADWLQSAKFDLRYVLLSSVSPQAITSDIVLTGSFSADNISAPNLAAFSSPGSAVGADVTGKVDLTINGVTYTVATI